MYARYDWSLFLAAVTLTAIGLLAIYGINISRGAADFFQLKKQLFAVALGIVFALGLPFIDYRRIRTLALPVYLGGAIMLGLVLLFGTTARNAGRWFVFGPLSFQPVEIAKVLMAIFLAAYFARHAHKRLTWTAFLGSGVGMAGYVVLVLLQPDFGSAMVLVAIWLAAVIFCGLPRHAWWILFLTVAASSMLVWNFGLRDFQRARISSFVNPAADPYGASYNVQQARIAIGSGGWLGKGIGEGSQARLRFLPEASTDFMFAVLGEELGFVGLSVVLLMFGFMLYRLMKIAMDAEDAFAGVLLVMIAAFIIFHLVINAGMNLGIMPVTGIPLPFLSAAASSVVVMFMTIGLAESIAVHGRRAF